MSVESEIDALYQHPPAEFVRARNALAKTLKGAEAARVRALAKPTVPAWAVNQLYWRDRHVFDRLVKAGTEMHRAQLAMLKGRASDVRATSAAQRSALGDAVQRTIALARDAHVQVDVDAITRTLEALSLSPEDVTPGRLSKPLQPAGFEALAGVKIPAHPAPSRAPAAHAHQPAATSPAAPHHERDRLSRSDLRAMARAAARASKEAKRAEATRRAEEKRVAAKRRGLERALARARRDEEAARHKLAASQKEVADAELRLRALT